MEKKHIKIDWLLLEIQSLNAFWGERKVYKAYHKYI